MDAAPSARNQRRPSRFAAWFVVTSGRKRAAICLAVVVAITAILAVAGAWNTASPRYWRAVAQRLLLTGAQRASGRMAVQLAHLGMRTHRSGLTTEELASAAGIFERNDRMAQAAMLWLGVAHARVVAHQPSKAIDAAQRAHRAFPTQETATTLVLLHWNDAKRAEWVEELARYTPNHEIVQTLICLGDIPSLDAPLPAPCMTSPWVAELATQAQHVYRQHVTELETLPEAAARKARVAEIELAEYRSDLESYGRESAALARERRNETIERFFIGTFKVLTPAWPEPHETPEEYGRRLAYCETIGKPDCTLRDIGEEVQKHRIYVGEWQERNSSLNHLADLTGQLVDINARQLREWTSTDPFRALVAQRDAVLPDLSDTVQSRLYERQLPVGLPSQPMLASLLSAGPDAQTFRMLGARRATSTGEHPPVRKIQWDNLAALRSPRDTSQPIVARVHGQSVDEDQYANLFGVALEEERGVVYRMGLVLQDPRYGGARVTNVLPNTPASAAGIQLFDMIHVVNGVGVGSWDDLIREVQRHHCGDRFDLQVYRSADDAHHRLSIQTTSSFPCGLGIQGTDGVTDRMYVEVVGITSPSAKANGIQYGDLITRVDGRWLRTAEDIRQAVQKYGLEHGTPAMIPVTFRRRGTDVELQMSLARERRLP